MNKPDFEKMAGDFWQAMRDKKAVSLVAVLESAFDAGLERAAAKCELTMVGTHPRNGWASEEMPPEYFEETQARHHGQAYASIIRAEKSQ